MIRAQILNLLAQLREERNLALLVITRDLSVLAQVTDRVASRCLGEVPALEEPVPGQRATCHVAAAESGRAHR
jgi:ABC-type dipeptide/oligopeptide/nickel transport system ATPase component